MPVRKIFLLLFWFQILPIFLLAQYGPGKNFTVIPLGVEGGIDESNLSAYMVAPAKTHDYVCLDAGTLFYGVKKAISNKAFSISPEEVIRKYIKGYCISHAHLDHVAGLIINSPDDSTKNIYGLKSTLETLERDYFTWESWANFGDAGEKPLLAKYHYKILLPDSTTEIANTQMSVQAFPLSHGNIISTAFLLKNKNNYLLYLGDTGPDEAEKSADLHHLWVAIAPLLKNGQLKGIFIETSFPDSQPDRSLFGHLTPRWLLEEINDLASLTGKKVLKGFNVVITHIKPPQHNIDLIRKELQKENQVGVHLIFPEQGVPIEL
jgi:cAMP phosphodiesterase